MPLRSLAKLLFILCFIAVAGTSAPSAATARPGVELAFAKTPSRWSFSRVTARNFRPEVSYRISFPKDDTGLTPANAEMLDKLATWIVANPRMPFAILANQDAEGTSGENLDLAIDQAENVANYLVSKGVPVKRVNAALELGAEIANAAAATAALGFSSGSDTQPMTRPSSTTSESSSGDSGGSDGGSRSDNRDGSKHDKGGRK